MQLAVTEAGQAVAGVLSDVLHKGEATWAALAEAGLLAVPVPTDHGGEGFGLAEVSVLLRELGRQAAPLPIWETFCCGVFPIAASGPAELQAAVLPGVIDGEVRFAAALNEPGEAFPEQPRTTLTAGLLTGRKVRVPLGEDAEPVTFVLVPATAEDGVTRVAVVDLTADGITVHRAQDSRGLAAATLEFEAVAPVGVLDAEGWPTLRDHARAGLAVLGAGLLEGARDLTAEYIKGRQQFGRSLAEFQAVAMQIADVFVASRTLTLAANSATWRLDQAIDAGEDLAVAGYWFAAQAPAAVQTCHHLHGGMGLDITYPLHRYSSWVKDIAHQLGGIEQTLAEVAIAESAAKNAELTAEQRAFKAEVRAYFEQLVSREQTLDMMINRHGDTFHQVVKQLGADGWMGVGWPTEYGGKGYGPVEQQIFVNEAARSDVHLPSVTLQTVGPTLQTFGTQKQKDLFLADILSGDVHFAIGYSEPDAGTDLASLRTTARREGDHYVVNGQKMWTTGGHAADYIWLAVRTDADAPKHKGISVLIVDTKDPGFSWTPIITADGSHHVNATYYSDVRVPVDMLVGEENKGWNLITTQLNHERVMLAPAGRFEGLRDLVREWAASQGIDDKPDVHAALAHLTAVFRVNELWNWQVASGTGLDVVADSSASKVFAADQMQLALRSLEEILARYGDPADSETQFLQQYLDGQAKRFLVLTFGGGVNEVQRELVAMFGMKLPKVPR